MDNFNVGNFDNQPTNQIHQVKIITPKLRFVLNCGQSSQTVFVHGHEQCVFCKSNVDPCCQS